MSEKTNIEWTQATWNPVLGCSKKSPGCKHCYAIRAVHRLAGNPNEKVRKANEGLTVIQGGQPNWTGVVRLIPERLQAPLRNKKPTTYFVNSLSDLFHEALPDEDIDRVFAVMALCQHHRFQILTKTADRMRRYFATSSRELLIERQLEDIPFDGVWIPRLPLPNVWLGVSAEDQQRADERIPHLLQTPAAVRFVSIEPLLSWMDLGCISKGLYRANALTGDGFDGRGVDWVIVGGESGPGARPMHPEWARSLQDQCIAAGVHFFFKQWGEWMPAKVRGTIWETADGNPWPSSLGAAHDWGDGHGSVRVGKKAAGRLLDGLEWNEMPEMA